MHNMVQDPIDKQLLSNWQRDFPMVSRPFEVLAQRLGTCESRIILRLHNLSRRAIISRVGGIVRPNIIGASTLAAMAVPSSKVDDTAAMIGKEPGVNHSYLRENKLNLWFVVTGPDRDHVLASLARIEQRTGARVYDLRLEQSFHIDLGFSLDGQGTKHREPSDAFERSSAFNIEDADARLVQELTRGLPLERHPYQSIALRLGRTESSVIARLEQLSDARIIKRLGVIVRHRSLGWSSNAMVVWDVPADEIDAKGSALAAASGITLCYRRTRIEPDWPYNLYAMVHAKKRSDAMKIIASSSKLARLSGCPRKILFSTRCFKQTGALICAPQEAA